MNQSLEGRNVLVTGGNGGIGRGIAQGMVDAGANVAIIGRKDSVGEVASELSTNGKEVVGLQADLADRNQLI